jgi:hypothetical protein
VRISDDPPVSQVAEYVEKYRDRIAGIGQTLEQFTEMFTVPLRFTITKVRGH